MLYINTKNNTKNQCSFYFGLEEFLIKDFDYNKDIFLLWSVEPTVMMGRHQITDLEINANFVKDNDIKIVRRNSGGGAVFTDPGCLQFSFITDKQNHSNIFIKHAQHIIDNVKKLGIDATFTGRNDILSDGLKFSGNAEYIYKDRMVIHGTILFDTNFENLVGSLNPDLVKLTSKAITSVKSRVVNIGTKTDLSLDEFYDFLVENISSEVIDYESLDVDLINRYASKFNTHEWNYGRNPEFEIVKKQKFQSGNYKVELSIKKEVVKSIRISGDFFTLKELEEFESNFIGIEYSYEAFLKVLKLVPIKDYIHKMRTSHFLELVFGEYRKNKISKPDYLKINLADLNKQTSKIRTLLKQHNLHTVCQEANCPNQLECFSQKTATFMILGTKCTRNCKFCDVDFGRPDAVDSNEPHNLLKAVKLMNLEHVVITSVTRDDLSDFGANQFAECIKLLKKEAPNTTVEVLIPDLMGDIEALKIIVDAKPDVVNHNIETVKRLSKGFRDNALYSRSLNVLSNVKKLNKDMLTKSGVMVGIGETHDEISELMDDLRNHSCDILTIGQYLRPSMNHAEVKEYVSLERFDEYKEIGKQKGFRYIASGPLVRSSYHAKRQFEGE